MDNIIDDKVKNVIDIIKNMEMNSIKQNQIVMYLINAL